MKNNEKFNFFDHYIRAPHRGAGRSPILWNPNEIHPHVWPQEKKFGRARAAKITYTPNIPRNTPTPLYVLYMTFLYFSDFYRRWRGRASEASESEAAENWYFRKFAKNGKLSCTGVHDFFEIFPIFTKIVMYRGTWLFLVATLGKPPPSPPKQSDENALYI